MKSGWIETENKTLNIQVELELADRELSFSVSPMRATIIYQFQDQSMKHLILII